MKIYKICLLILYSFAYINSLSLAPKDLSSEFYTGFLNAFNNKPQKCKLEKVNWVSELLKKIDKKEINSNTVLSFINEKSDDITKSLQETYASCSDLKKDIKKVNVKADDVAKILNNKNLPATRKGDMFAKLILSTKNTILA